MSRVNAHIFKRSSRGEREEVQIRLLDLDGSPLCNALVYKSAQYGEREEVLIRLLSLDGSPMLKAHIFKRRSVGEREEVFIKLFNLDGSPFTEEEPEEPVDPIAPLEEWFSLGGLVDFTDVITLTTDTNLGEGTASIELAADVDVNSVGFETTWRVTAPNPDFRSGLEIYIYNRGDNDEWTSLGFIAGDAVEETPGVWADPTLRMFFADESFDRDLSDPIPFDPVNHLWFQLKLESGNMLWRVSPDGEDWTDLQSKPWAMAGPEGAVEVDLVSNENADNWDATSEWQYLSVNGVVIFSN